MSPKPKWIARRWLLRITPGRTDELLDIEILKSERIRSLAVLSIVASGALVWLAIYLLAKDSFNESLGMQFPFEALLFTLVGAALYESGLALALRFLIARRRRFPDVPRHLHTILETSIPGMLLWILCERLTSPLFALLSPLTLIFFLFIILSILRLRMGLSALTGLTAAIWLAALS